MSTSWFSGGTEIIVTTTCRDGEGEDACAERHNEAVEFWKTIFPEEN